MRDDIDGAPVDERICRLCRYARRFFLLAWLHSATFMAVSVALGGTTSLGKVVDGQHFLGDHGRYRPVSRAVYEVMAVYERVALTVFILGFAAIVLHNVMRQCKDVPKRWGVW